MLVSKGDPKNQSLGFKLKKLELNQIQNTITKKSSHLYHVFHDLSSCLKRKSSPALGIDCCSQPTPFFQGDVKSCGALIASCGVGEDVSASFG